MELRRSFWLGLVGALFVLGTYGCGPSYPECHDDKNCAEKNEYCLNAKCAQCRDDSHCVSRFDESFVCNGGTCARINGYCNPPAFNCPTGQKCRDRRCGPECLGPEECPPGQICENGRCRMPPECTSDEDCPAGQICQNERCVLPPVCQPRTIYFDFDESAIRSDAKNTLNSNFDCFKSRGINAMELTGHCDERGTEEYNMALGNRRARATESVLQKMGVAKRAITTRSRGEYEPVVPNAQSEADHQRNRRVEFVYK